MNRKKALIYIAAVLLLVLATVFSAVKLISGETQMGSIEIGKTEANDLRISNHTRVESLFETPQGGLTGLSFRFTCPDKNMEDAKLQLLAENLSTGKTLFEGELRLDEQVYDCQMEEYRIIVPFYADAETHTGDEICITAKGIDIDQDTYIYLKTSDESGVESRLRVNGREPEKYWVISLYYTAEIRNYVGIGIAWLCCVIAVVLLVGLCRRKWNTVPVSKRTEKKERTVDWKRLFALKNVFKMALLMIALFIGLEYVYYAGVCTNANLVFTNANGEITEGAQYIRLYDGKSRQAEYTIQDDYVVGLQCWIKDADETEGIIQVDIEEAETRRELLSCQVDIAECERSEDGIIDMVFPEPLRGSAGEEVLVTLEYCGDSSVKIWPLKEDKSVPWFTEMYMPYIGMKQLFLIFSLMVALFTGLIYAGKLIGVRANKLLAAALVLLGLIFGGVMTPFTVPDEASHVDSVYRVSNKLLGVEDTNIEDAIYKREGDIFVDADVRRYIDPSQYKWLYENGLETGVSNRQQLTFAADNSNNTSFVFYLLAAIGLTIGRLLHWGFLPSIMLARICNLLAAVLISCFAVKKAPFGKLIFAVLLLFPVTIQELASVSYDALIIPVAFLFTAYALYAYHASEPLKTSEILVMLGSALLLASCKGCAYMPLLLFGLLVIYKKKYWKGHSRFAFVVLSGILVMLTAVSIYASELLGMFFRSQANAYARQNSKELYSVEYLLGNPREMLRILENTVHYYFDNYVQTLTGARLGSWQVSSNEITQMAYVILALIAVISAEHNDYPMDVSERAVLVVAGAISCGLAMLSMLLNWTPFGAMAIQGVQGRYFLPVLPAMLLGLCRKKMVTGEDFAENLVFGGYMLGVITIMQVVVNVAG